MIPFADGHCDFLYGMAFQGYSLSGNRARYQNMTLDGLKKGGVALQFFAAWTDTSMRMPCCQQFLTMLDAYGRMLEDNDTLIPLQGGDAPSCAGDGKIRTVLTIEGAESIEGSLALLRQYKRMGVAAATLTWNENNELAGAALARGNKGLTSLGRDVVREMERIGMALDVAHLSDRAIEEALDMTEMPVFASHTNCRAVFDSPRSLPDALIRRIASRGGTIGINFYNKQLTKYHEACIADIVAQVRHLADVGGIGCCAIGSDFDGMPVYPRDLRDSGDLQALAEALRNAGFKDEELTRMLFTNLWEYIRQFV